MHKILIAGAFILSAAFYGCGNAEVNKQSDSVGPDTSSKGELAYICPCGGCPEIREKEGGACSKCGMELVKEKQ